MRRPFPYKTKPCEDCTPATRENCDTCFGSGRDIELIEHERDKATLRKALDDVFAAGRALGRAVGLR